MHGSHESWIAHEVYKRRNTMPYTYKIEQHNTISITILIFEIITITVVGINNEHIVVLNNYLNSKYFMQIGDWN